MKPITVHLFHADLQPATRYVDNFMTRRMVVENPPHRLLVTSCCGRRRQAKNLTVQVYYDQTLVWCREGHGCRKRTDLPAHLWCKRKRCVKFRQRRYGLYNRHSSSGGHRQ